jgi:protein-disulfide isomerase
MKRVAVYLSIALLMLVPLSGCQKRTPPPAVKAPLDGSWSDPAKGPAHAMVTIYEFSDFQCPFCSHAEPVIDSVMKANPGKVRLVFKQFPLPFHKNAHLAAEAMLAAHDQGFGWQMHDALFAHREVVEFEGVDGVARIARDFITDTGRFNRAVADGMFKTRVDADIDFGKSVGVYATPAFLVNGALIVGAQPLDAFSAAVADAMARADALMKTGLKLEDLDAAFIKQAKKAARKAPDSPVKGTAPRPGDPDEGDTEGE